MSKVKIKYDRRDVLFIIHNETIWHPKNMGSYWDKKKKSVIVEFIQRDKRVKL